MTDRKTNIKKIILAVVVILYAIALMIVGGAYAERAVVKQEAEAVLQEIKDGPDDETMNKIADRIISSLIGDGMTGSFLQKRINGEDINDIYDAVMYKFRYEVTAVERAGEGSYRIGVSIQNNDNIQIAKGTWELIKSRYGGNIIAQLREDLSGDKSQLIASLFKEAADNYHTQFRFQRNYVVRIDAAGKQLYFENENGTLSFLLACAGINVPSGSTAEIRDEYQTYKMLLIALALIGVAGAAYLVYRGFKAKKAKDSFQDATAYAEATVQGQPAKQAQAVPPGYAAPQPTASRSRTPILYAQSDQHGNTPYAVHGVPILIGRDKAGCKIVFKDGTAGVSGRHCSISYDTGLGQFVLVDLRSTYGTFLANGEKLMPDKQYYLKPGDGFFLGDRANMFKVEMCET